MISCKYQDNCGGCNYLGKEYQETLDIKLDEFKNILTKKEINPNNFNNIKIQASPNPINYRVRCQLHVRNGKIGFFKPRTNDLIEIEECIMLKQELNQKIKTLKFPNNYNGKIELMFKDGKVNEFLIEKQYENNFCQVNEEVNTLIKDEVIKLTEANKEDKILELYCGMGNFSFDLAKKTELLCGIDIVVPANKTKTLHDAINKKNPYFIKSDTYKGIQDLEEKNMFQEFNKLILDPPRIGTSTKVLQKIKNRKFDKIIYVSCNPETFINDAKELIQSGYKWESCKLFDMFPYTKYVESVNLFSLYA